MCDYLFSIKAVQPSYIPTQTQSNSYYKLDTGTMKNEENCQPDGVCHLRYLFEWQDPDSMCKSSFVCTKLQGKIVFSRNLITKK